MDLNLLLIGFASVLAAGQEARTLAAVAGAGVGVIGIWALARA